ncbi:MAG: lantibiotic dehydratase [Nannocystaceae bacterium]
MAVPFELSLLRVPALPITVLCEIRLGAALRANTVLRARRQGLEAQGKLVAQALHPAVASAERSDRARVLDLRRAAFNGRAPRSQARRVVGRLPPMVREQVEPWVRAWDELDELRRARDASFARERSAVHARLLELLALRSLRLALELSTPLLAAELEQMRARGGSTRARDHKAMRRALSFVYRAMLKPTPCSWFASCALVQRRTEGGGPTLPTPLSLASHVQADRGVLWGLTQWLLQRPELRGRARARLSTSSARDEHGLWCSVDDGVPVRVTGLDLVFERLSAAPARALPWSVLVGECGEAEVSRALEVGLVELDAGAADDRVDDLDVLRDLVESVTEPDDALVVVRNQLASYRGVVTRLATAALPRFETPDDAAGLASVLHEDCYAPAPLSLGVAGLPAVLSQVQRLGAQWVVGPPLPEERTVLALFERLSPTGAAVRWPSFYRAYRSAREELGLDTADHWHNAPALASAWGIELGDPTASVRDDLERALANAAGGSDEVVLEPSLGGAVELDERARRRLALRLAPVRSARGAPRHHLVLWGSDRMSLLPRYLRLPFEGGDHLATARRWMARWPEVADIGGAPGGNPDLRPRITRRVVAGPGARVRPGDVELRDAWVEVRPTTGRLGLRDGERGEWIVPTFLGVSAPTRLPASVQLLLHLHGQRPSYMDVFYRELHQALLRRIVPGSVVRLPAVIVEPGLVLCTPLSVVPTAMLPLAAKRVDRDTFFAFHDWMAAQGLPCGVVQARAWGGGRDGQWLDLDHPDGVASLLRLSAGSTHVVLIDPWLPEGGEGLRTPEGDFRVEHYLEIDAGAAQG